MAPNDLFTNFDKGFTSFFRLMCFMVVVCCLSGVMILSAVIYGAMKLAGVL